MSREKQIFGVESITELPCLRGAKQCWCEVECEDCIESHLLAAGYRKQAWIGVNERLPDIDPHGKGRYGGQRSVRVLCACKQKGGKTFVKEGYYEPCGNGRVCWRIPGSIDAVTHWMPLPEPPKGE